MQGAIEAEVVFIAAMMVLILIISALAVFFFFRQYKKEMREKALRNSGKKETKGSTGVTEEGPAEGESY